MNASKLTEKRAQRVLKEAQAYSDNHLKEQAEEREFSGTQKATSGGRKSNSPKTEQKIKEQKEKFGAGQWSPYSAEEHEGFEAETADPYNTKQESSENLGPGREKLPDETPSRGRVI